MIDKVLDYTQKLFSRAFLISALVPSVIFALVIGYIYWGIEDLSKHVQEWVSEDWKQNVLTLFLVSLSIYLIAFTIYGLRAAIQQIYYGQWSFPFSILINLKLKLSTKSFERKRKLKEFSENAFDDIKWVEENEFFNDLNQEYELSLLERLKYRWFLFISIHNHKKIVSLFADNKKLKSRHLLKYWKLLSRARALQSNRLHFSETSIVKLDELIKNIKAAHLKPSQLSDSLDSWKALTKRNARRRFNDYQRNFPVDQSWLQPTRLGNIVSGLEEYTLKRYEINFSTIWSRLIHAVPKESMAHIEDAVVFCDYTLSMSWLSLVAAVCAGIFAITNTGRRAELILTFVLCMLSFWIFYQLAIQATRSYVSQMQALVDLFHLKLFELMEFKRPDTLQKEISYWKELKVFFGQGNLPDVDLYYRPFEQKEKSDKSNVITSAGNKETDKDSSKNNS